MPDSDLPEPLSHAHVKKPPAAIMEMLRVLLKHVSDEKNIAPRLIASTDDLELLARMTTPYSGIGRLAAQGFGNTALKLKHGEIALAVKHGRIRLITDIDPAG